MSKVEKISALRGMNDLLPQDSAAWLQLERIVQDWLASYGYRNMRPPILEHTHLFVRGIGEVTDVVEKEMYAFTDRADKDGQADHIALRPEFTAGLVRAAIEHNITYGEPQRIWSMGPAFRREKPQKGRYRQFHQIDVEAFGYPGPDIDAEVIVMIRRLLTMLGITDVRLELNSLGALSERQAHRTALISYFEQHFEALDEDGKRRLHSNPLRLLDSKTPSMQPIIEGAPKLSDYWGDETRAHLDGLRRLLDASGIEYRINPRLVRGLDYYNLTVFEWVTDRLGAQGTVCGGGRYDGMFELLGGKPTPSIGFGMGVERLMALWQASQQTQSPPQCDVYIVHQGSQAQVAAFMAAEKLRDAGLDVLLHAGSGNFKAQFKRADAAGAAFAVVIGDDEAASGHVSLKDMRSEHGGEQRTLTLEAAADAMIDALTQTDA